MMKKWAWLLLIFVLCGCKQVEKELPSYSKIIEIAPRKHGQWGKIDEVYVIDEAPDFYYVAWKRYWEHDKHLLCGWMPKDPKYCMGDFRNHYWRNPYSIWNDGDRVKEGVLQ